MATGVIVPGPDVGTTTSAPRKVIVASTLGTTFSWYDFNLFAVLSPVIGQEFFPDADENTALVFALLAFSAGFIVRPLGAVIFGRLGDPIGRKFAFLISMLTMGLATFGVGVLPGYEAIGLPAPILLIGLRLLQGLALGGEYGGAVIYVAEHAPPEGRAHPVPALDGAACTLALDACLTSRVAAVHEDGGGRGVVQSPYHAGVWTVERSQAGSPRPLWAGHGLWGDLVCGPGLRAAVPDPDPEGGRRNRDRAGHRAFMSCGPALHPLRLALRP